MTLRLREQPLSEAATVWNRGRWEREFLRPSHQLWPELLTRLPQPKGSQAVESYPVPRKNMDLGRGGQVGGEVGMVSEDQDFS